MEEADGVVVSIMVTRSVEVEVEEAAKAPKACKMGIHPDQDLKVGKVEDKVCNKAQKLGNLLFIRRSSSFYR